MDRLSASFNSSFLKSARIRPAKAAGGGSSGTQQRQAAAAGRHFAIAPPAPKPSGGMPEFKPLFTARPPVPHQAATASADETQAIEKQAS